MFRFALLMLLCASAYAARAVDIDTAATVYQALYSHFRKLYFAFGQPDAEFGGVLHGLRHIARES